MRVILSGASGFIGRPTLACLARRGHAVLALSRLPAPSDVPPDIGWEVCDLAERSSYESAMAAFQPEAAIHLAWEGIPDFSLGKCLDNVRTGTLFLQTLLDAGCDRVVVGGSCWEYGRSEGMVQEGCAPLRPGVFAAAKIAQYHLGKALSEAAGAAFAWARIFFAYGPRQREGALAPSICRALLSNRPSPVQRPEALQDFIFVEDVADALVFLAEHRVAGIFNVGSGELTSVARVANHLRACAGLAPEFSVPAEGAGSGLCADMGVMRGLGWAPGIPLEEGLKRTFHHFKEVLPL